MIEIAARYARGLALASRAEGGPARAYAERFDAVQAIAEELESAGEIDDGPVRSAQAGPWTWRHVIAEALDDEMPRADRAVLVGYG